MVRSTNICRIKGWQGLARQANKQISACAASTAGGARWGMESLSYAKHKNFYLQSLVNRIKKIRLRKIHLLKKALVQFNDLLSHTARRRHFKENQAISLSFHRGNIKSLRL